MEERTIVLFRLRELLSEAYNLCHTVSHLSSRMKDPYSVEEFKMRADDIGKHTDRVEELISQFIRKETE